MDAILVLMILLAFAMIVVGAILFLTSKAKTQNRVMSMRLSVGGLLIFLLAMVIIPSRPSFHHEPNADASNQPVPASDPSTDAVLVERSDPAADLHTAAVDFYRNVMSITNACGEAAAGAYLSGEDLGQPGGKVEKYYADTRDAMDACKNANTLLGAVDIPELFSSDARRAAVQMVTICRRATYQNQYASSVVLGALDGSAPIGNVKSYLQFQHDAQSAFTACDHETYNLAVKTGADLDKMWQQN